MLIFQNVGVQIPVEDGKVVGMCQFRDRVLIATEYGRVYEIVDDGFQNFSLRQVLIDRVAELERTAHQATGSKS